MALTKQTYDGVIEAVHYHPNGEVAWVRAYLRRGAAFSDLVLLDRPSLVKALKAGKRFVIGERVPYLAGTFNVHGEVRLLAANGREALVSGDAHGGADYLPGAPLV